MDDQEELETDSPATRLLDALGRGDLNALLLEFRPTTIVRTDDHSWSVQGEDEVLYWLEEAFEHFPGLVFDSHARHIGYGQVIEEARVRDIGPQPLAAESGANPDHAADPGGQDEAHQAQPGAALVLDRDFGKREGPQLNMPVRVTVLHDDAFVHEIIASYPRALLHAAMGLHVDPLDMAVSEIQSAFVAPSGSGFKTYQMDTNVKPETEYATPLPVPLARVATEPEPEPDPEPEPELLHEPEPEPEPVVEQPRTPPPLVPDDEDDQPRRRRALVAVPLVMVLVAAIAAGTWWLGRDDNAATAGPNDRQPAQSAPRNSDQPTKEPSASAPASTAPTQNPSETKAPKPDVTLKSDLAFAKNSAELSNAAKRAIARLADEIRAARLKGTILVHGYTDNLGSAAHGLELSKERAQAVAQYLRGSLGTYEIGIRAFGHGEADPIASNATERGQQKNRRVTITLPKSE
jgi:outer membrane protein OmpA-like peptidoglycan-associated protein